MNYTLKHLQALVALSRTGSFTAAAAQLHLTRSSLSLTIKELENQLGFTVFHRTTRRVSLTEGGKALLPHAERIVSEYQASLWVARNLGRQSDGVLRVACSQLMAATLLPDVLTEFCALYPRVDVQVVDVRIENLAEAVMSGQVDLAVGPERPFPDKLSAQLLFSLPIACLCAGGHPFAAREAVTWKEMAQEKLVSADRAAMLMQMRDIRYAEQLVASIQANHLLTCLALVSRNTGVMPCMVHVEPLLPMFGIRMVPLVAPEVERRLVLMKVADRRLSVPAEAFAKQLQDLLPKYALAQPGVVAWKARKAGDGDSKLSGAPASDDMT